MAFFLKLKKKLLNNKMAQAFLEHNRKSALKKKTNPLFFFKQPLVHRLRGGGFVVEAGHPETPELNRLRVSM